MAERLFSENEVNFIVEDLEALAKDNEDGAAKVSEIVNSLKHFSHSSDMEFKEVDIRLHHKALKVAANAMKSRREAKLRSQLNCLSSMAISVSCNRYSSICW